MENDTIQKEFEKNKDTIEKIVIQILKENHGKTIIEIAREFTGKNSLHYDELYLEMTVTKMEKEKKIISNNGLYYLNGEYHG